MQILYSYFQLVISDTLVGSFLDVLFLLLAVILSGLHEKPRRNKDWVTEKKYIEEFMWGTSLSWMHALLSLSLFVAFFIYSFPFPKWHTCWVAQINIHNIALGDILCDYEWTVKNMKISCNLILANLHL